MKINPTQVLKNYEGEPLKDSGKDLTLGRALINTINLVIAGDEETKMNAEEQVRAYELSIKLLNEEEVELKAEDVANIKKRIVKTYSPVVAGQVIQILEK